MDLFEGIKTIVEIGTVGIVLYLFMQYRNDKKEQDKVSQQMLDKKDDQLRELNKDLLDAFKRDSETRVMQVNAFNKVADAVDKNTDVVRTFTERFSNAVNNR